MQAPKFASRFSLPPASRQAGFSLIELLVSVVIMAEILVGVAILFDASNRLARSQTHLAELQQSLRVGQSEVVRFARMAGIGGLPITRVFYNPDAHPGEQSGGSGNYDLLGAFPRGGYAISVLNNVAAGTTFSSSVTGSNVEALEGSDVLILRGVFTTPLYYLDPPVGINQQVVISNRVRAVGQIWEDYPQDLDALGARLIAAQAATDDLHQKVALIVRDTLNPNAYAVRELNDDVPIVLTPACPSPSPPFPNEDCLRTLTFSLRLDITTEPGLSYARLTTGTFLERLGGTTISLPATADPPSAIDPVPVPLIDNYGSIGLLEEYRFFVRVEHEVPGAATTHLSPVLARARFQPGTDEMIDRVDIADNVIDLQIAIGADANSRGHPGDGVILDNGTEDDEVLFNSAADTNGATYEPPDGVDEAASPPHPPDPGSAVTWYDPEVERLEFHFLRINTLVQSRVPDPRIQAPALSPIEDFNRGSTVTINSPILGTLTYNDETQYHRRWLQTVVELRNLL